MKRIGKFILGAAVFLALGYLLVYVTKAQTHFESHTDRRFALVNQTGAITVIVYADEVVLNEGSGASGFYRGGNLVAWMRSSSGLRVREMFAADGAYMFGGKDSRKGEQ